ncbi:MULTISPECIES: hypothetical protein [Bacillus]|nr:hypothetical protein [Bacillus paralicheniformis]
MKTFDLLLKGASVVCSDVRKTDIGVKDGMIAEPGVLDGSASIHF